MLSNWGHTLRGVHALTSATSEHQTVSYIVSSAARRMCGLRTGNCGDERCRLYIAPLMRYLWSSQLHHKKQLLK